jgi:hypothetical protein
VEEEVKSEGESGMACDSSGAGCEGRDAGYSMLDVPHAEYIPPDAAIPLSTLTFYFF